MAVDLTNKALDIANQGADAADAFLDAFEQLEKVLAVSLDSGISMTDYDDDLAASEELMHFNGAEFNRLATAVPNIATAIDAAGSAGSGRTIRENFNKLRKNL